MYFERWIDVQPKNNKDKVSGSLLIGVKLHEPVVLSENNFPNLNYDLKSINKEIENSKCLFDFYMIFSYYFSK